ncbi:MAG: hypothetical protein ACI9R3_004137 [Verrucomicrobiales bacterium]
MDEILRDSVYGDEGDEHKVWFPGAIASREGFEYFEPSVIKVTHPDQFGLRVVYRQDEDPRCLPLEYFERWMLHCELFGDVAEFVAAYETDEGKLCTIVKQQLIKGEPPELDEIESFFLGNGWLPFELQLGVGPKNRAFFDREKAIVVSDTHRGNLVRVASGALLPIDLRIQRVDGALYEAVAALCDQGDRGR